MERLATPPPLYEAEDRLARPLPRPPVFNLPGYTTLTPPRNVIQEVFDTVLVSPTLSPEPEVMEPISIVPIAPLIAPIVLPAGRRKPGRPKGDTAARSATQAHHITFELLVYVIIPDKRVRQRGGKTKSEKREPLKKGPIEVNVNSEWNPFLHGIAELLQTTTANLITDTFEWRWLKPANGPWLPLTSERGFCSMVKQIVMLTKSDPYVILRMQSPRPNAEALVSSFFVVDMSRILTAF
jgi:hypothetical protein